MVNLGSAPAILSYTCKMLIILITQIQALEEVQFWIEVVCNLVE